jgi:signal transduction histidine kinase
MILSIAVPVLARRLPITLDLDPATKPIFVDRVQLETAITNLANNARISLNTS